MFTSPTEPDRRESATRRFVVLRSCSEPRANTSPATVPESHSTSEKIVDENCSVAGNLVPMTKSEQQALLRKVRPVAIDGRLEWYKSTQLFDAEPHRVQHGFPNSIDVP